MLNSFTCFLSNVLLPQVHTFEDALRNHQFRFQDIRAVQPCASSTTTDGAASSTAGSLEVTPSAVSMGAWQRHVPGHVLGPLPPASSSSGSSVMQPQLLYRISHEVRSLQHPLFLRPLYNRSAGGFL